MPLPVLHSFAGYSIYRASVPEGERSSQLAALCVILANLADLDFLPGLAFGRSELFHRGFTHSLGAAILFGAAATFFVGLSRPCEGTQCPPHENRRIRPLAEKQSAQMASSAFGPPCLPAGRLAMTKYFPLFFLAYFSHIVLDSLNGPGTAMPVLWPLGQARWAMPFSLSLGNDAMRTGGGLHDFAASLLSPAAFERLFFELSLVALITVWSQIGKEAKAGVRLGVLSPRTVLGLLLFAVCIAFE